MTADERARCKGEWSKTGCYQRDQAAWAIDWADKLLSAAERVQELEGMIGAHERARDLMNKGFESTCELQSELKQKVRTLEAEAAAWRSVAERMARWLMHVDSCYGSHQMYDKLSIDSIRDELADFRRLAGKETP